MSKSEFVPLNENLDAAFCKELVEDGIMPTAVVAIYNTELEKVYAVASTRHRISGLPIIDLARLSEEHTPENYVGYRLKKRFGLCLPENVIQVIPVESNESPYIEDISNRDYQHIHRRIYFPFIGKTDIDVNTKNLCLATRGEIISSIASPQGDDTLYQLIDIHKEILYKHLV